MAKIAINGFGRIGRALFKLVAEKADSELEIVAINDLGDPENLIYLLKFDSVYGKYDRDVELLREGDKTYLESGNIKALFLQQKDATQLPWGDLGVDIVVEASGAFESYEKAAVHKTVGAKRVVLTAPAKDEDNVDARTVLMGVNEEVLKTCSISSNGSCTTNSASPALQILSETIGIKKAFLNTTHGYTATQNLIDGPVKGHDFRRGRAAGVNIVPSYTGAAVAVGRAVESVAGKFQGVAMRVPVATGSLSAITFVAERSTTVEEINEILEKSATESRWQGIFRTTRDQLVSTDIVGDPHAAIADLSLTAVVDGDLCTVYSWYDNEFGYTNSLLKHILTAAKNI